MEERREWKERKGKEGKGGRLEESLSSSKAIAVGLHDAALGLVTKFGLGFDGDKVAGNEDDNIDDEDAEGVEVSSSILSMMTSGAC